MQTNPDYVGTFNSSKPAGAGKELSLWERWKDAATRAATLLARILLTVFYWIVVTPFAWGVRLCSEPLGMSRKSSLESGWKPSSPIKAESQF